MHYNIKHLNKLNDNNDPQACFGPEALLVNQDKSYEGVNFAFVCED